jgi:Protein of unknown function (DUF3134)
MNNPALSEEARYEPAKVITPQENPSFLDWLSTNNRLIRRQPEERVAKLDEDVDFSDLVEGEYQVFEDEGDDLEELDISADDDELLPE